MADSRCVLACAAIGAVYFHGAAYAAHPLQTEDTGTQGAGNVEIENGFAQTRAAGRKTFIFQPQLSYGLGTTLDLIVQPSWISSRTGAAPAVRAWGDTNLDAKWRWFGEAPYSLAVRAGVTLATGQDGEGIPHGKTAKHALLVGTLDLVPFMLHANLGWTLSPSGSGLAPHSGHVSAAVMWAANEQLTLTVDTGADSNADPARAGWSSSALAGAIYTIRPGLDADIGYQSSLRASAHAGEWLVGLTYRFAL